jgi:hypothetical protein
MIPRATGSPKVFRPTPSSEAPALASANAEDHPRLKRVLEFRHGLSRNHRAEHDTRNRRVNTGFENCQPQEETHGEIRQEALDTEAVQKGENHGAHSRQHQGLTGEIGCEENGD